MMFFVVYSGAHHGTNKKIAKNHGAQKSRYPTLVSINIGGIDSRLDRNVS